MVNKKGKLAGFGKVATPSNDSNSNSNINNDSNSSDKVESNTSNDIETDNNVSSNNNTIINSDTDNNKVVDVSSNLNSDMENNNDTEKNKDGKKMMTTLELIKEQTKASREKKKKQIAIYLDSDVAAELDRLAKKQGKGFKSELVNALLKNEFNNN